MATELSVLTGKEHRPRELDRGGSLLLNLDPKLDALTTIGFFHRACVPSLVMEAHDLVVDLDPLHGQ